jgi:hypothetical protein
MGSYQIPQNEIVILQILTYCSVLVGAIGFIFAIHHVQLSTLLHGLKRSNVSGLELRDIFIIFSFVCFLGESISCLWCISTAQFPIVDIFPTYSYLRIFFTGQLPGNIFIIVTLRLQIILFSSIVVRRWILRCAWILHLICTPLSFYFMYENTTRSDVAGWNKPAEFSKSLITNAIFFVATIVASAQSLRIAFQTPKVMNNNSKVSPSRLRDLTSSPSCDKKSDQSQLERANAIAQTKQPHSIQSTLNWNFKLFTIINVTSWIVFLSISLLMTKSITHLTRYRITLLCAIPAFFVEAMFRKRIKSQSTSSRLLSNNKEESFAIEESTVLSQ